MKPKRKHDYTDEAIAAVANLEPFEAHLLALLRAYKRGDRLADVCEAREESFRLAQEVDNIVRMVRELANAEVARRVLQDSPVAPAPVATSRG